MFKRVVSILKQLMGCQLTTPSLPTVATACNIAKPLPAKSSQVLQDVQAPAKLKPKRKSKAAPSTTAGKSRKAAPKPAQTTSGSRGRPRKTPAPLTQSPAPTKPKQKTEVAPSTKAVSKLGKKKPTARQVAMVSQSKPTGSKSETPARKTRQHAK